MGPAEPVRPVYFAPGSAALGRRQNSRAGQKSRAGDPRVCVCVKVSLRGWVQWLTLVIPSLEEAKAGGSLEAREYTQSTEKPFLLKIQKLARHGGVRLWSFIDLLYSNNYKNNPGPSSLLKGNYILNDQLLGNMAPEILLISNCNINVTLRCHTGWDPLNYIRFSLQT
ncbi:hypothetical protein AAY473_004280 [Plecturocebus cupreus]